MTASASPAAGAATAQTSYPSIINVPSKPSNAAIGVAISASDVAIPATTTVK